MGSLTRYYYSILALAFFVLIVGAGAKLDSETAQTTEENVKDTGGLLEDEYAGIDFSQDASDQDPEDDVDEAEARFLPQNMLSVVFTSKQRCFYEEIPEKSLLRGAWFLTTSETSPIYVRVKHTGSPQPLYDERHEEDTGGFTVTADEVGTYEYCFEHVNFPSDKDLVITFAVDVSTPSKVKTKAGLTAVKPEHVYPLQTSTSNLHHTVSSLSTEVDVILMRLDRHVLTQDSTEFRVSLLTSVETLAIAAITVFQIYFVRRLVNRSRQWV